MADRRFRPETLATHAGQIPDAATAARALPICQTTSFVLDSAEHAAALFDLQTFGNVCSRPSNPTMAGALCGGSVTMLAVNLARYGMETTVVDAAQPAAFAAATRPSTRAVFAESLGNRSAVVIDIAAVPEVAHAHGVPLVMHIDDILWGIDQALARAGA